MMCDSLLSTEVGRSFAFLNKLSYVLIPRGVCTADT